MGRERNGSFLYNLRVCVVLRMARARLPFGRRDLRLDGLPHCRNPHSGDEHLFGSPARHSRHTQSGGITGRRTRRSTEGVRSRLVSTPNRAGRPRPRWRRGDQPTQLRSVYRRGAVADAGRAEWIRYVSGISPFGRSRRVFAGQRHRYGVRVFETGQTRVSPGKTITTGCQGGVAWRSRTRRRRAARSCEARRAVRAARRHPDGTCQRRRWAKANRLP